MFQIGDMVKVTTRNTLRIGWVRRVTAKRVTVEASNGTERRSYSPDNVVLLNRRESRAEKLAKQAESLRQEAQAELAFELRAAFGPGVEVVNLVTGQRSRT